MTVPTTIIIDSYSLPKWTDLCGETAACAIGGGLTALAITSVGPGALVLFGGIGYGFARAFQQILIKATDGIHPDAGYIPTQVRTKEVISNEELKSNIRNDKNTHAKTEIILKHKNPLLNTRKVAISVLSFFAAALVAGKLLNLTRHISVLTALRVGFSIPLDLCRCVDSRRGNWNNCFR